MLKEMQNGKCELAKKGRMESWGRGCRRRLSSAYVARFLLVSIVLSDELLRRFPLPVQTQAPMNEIRGKGM